MNLSSSLLKTRAKTKLQGLYGQSVLVSLIYSMCISALSSAGAAVTLFTGGLSLFRDLFNAVESGNADAFFSSDNPLRYSVSFSPLSSLGSIATVLVAGPLAVGLAHYFLRVTDRNNPQIADLFAEFKNFGNTVVLNLLIGIFTFLWSLLFLIPGIVKGISYSMAPYIMAEHPEIKPLDAIKMSRQMMQGHKGEYFVLQLSFIGWYLLCILTVGIGFFFLSPYISAATAEFFNEVSGKNVAKRNNGIDPDGTGTFYGDAPTAAPNNGFGQPGQPPFNGGYSQPAQQPYQSGYGQPAQQPYQGGYGQPAQPQSYNGYGQPTQPRYNDGFTPPSAPPQDFTGYGQPDQQ